MSDPNHLRDLQVQRNTQSIGRWDKAATHREEVTRLLVGPAEKPLGGRLAVLGVGAANDLDLPRLADRYDEVALIDIDGGAITGGLERQGCAGRPEFRVHGDRDVTGVWAELSALRGREADEQAIAKLMSSIPSWEGLTDLGEYDVVASTCLLSQLVEGALSTLGESTPGVLAAVALRARHLRLLVEMLRIGGQGFLVTDFVASTTNPQLPQTPRHLLPAVLNQMLQQGNCFTALNPGRIVATLSEDPWLARHVESPGCLPPWLWDFGDRHYAVTALPLRRVERGEGG